MHAGAQQERGRQLSDRLHNMERSSRLSVSVKNGRLRISAVHEVSNLVMYFYHSIIGAIRYYCRSPHQCTKTLFYAACGECSLFKTWPVLRHLVIQTSLLHPFNEQALGARDECFSFQVEAFRAMVSLAVVERSETVSYAAYDQAAADTPMVSG